MIFLQHHHPTPSCCTAPRLEDQRLLPPQTARIRRRIHNLRNRRRIETDDIGGRAIQRKHRDARPTGHAVDGEAGEVLLHCDGDSVVDHGGQVGPVEEGVGDVLAVDGGADGELVRVGLVEEGAVEVVGVAGEGALGGGEDGALVVGRVAVAAVEDGWVEDILNVREHGRADAGEIEGEEFGVRGVVLDGGAGEEEAFVGVVADHDFDVLVERSLKEESAGQGGHE